MKCKIFYKMRYHKQVYFPDTEALKLFNSKLANITWNYSQHFLERIKSRSKNEKKVLRFINRLILKEKNIFEYYKENNQISVACYKIAYMKKFNLILVINNNKKILTIFYELISDKPKRINKNLYVKEVI